MRSVPSAFLGLINFISLTRLEFIVQWVVVSLQESTNFALFLDQIH